MEENITGIIDVNDSEINDANDYEIDDIENNEDESEFGPGAVAVLFVLGALAVEGAISLGRKAVPYVKKGVDKVRRTFKREQIVDVVVVDTDED